VCDRHYRALYLELPAEGGFSVNRVLMDSAALSKWITKGLAQWPPRARLVFVGADSTRKGELRWLVPAIEAVGGRAYQPDSAAIEACMTVALRRSRQTRLLANER
jgi:hypothetical protein